MVTMNIPASPQDLTPDWLTDALRSSGTLGDQRVTSLSSEIIGEGAGFLGQLARVQLEYDREGDAPSSLIGKFPTLDPGGREIGNIFRFYEREALFYQEIASEIELRVPRCYYNAMDVSAGQFLLLIEDLAPARVGDQLTCCSGDEVRLAIREIAKFHATWWEHERLASLEWMPRINDPLYQSAQSSYLKAWPSFVAYVQDKVPASLLEIGERLGPRVVAMLDSMESMPTTIVHGDYRLDNMFFGTPEGGAPLSVIDWQIANRGCGVFDPAYFLSGNVDTDLRRKHENELLHLYHRTLEENGVRGYSFEQCFDDYRACVLICLVYNVIGMGTLDFANERGVGMWNAWLSRTSAAILDLNAADRLPA